MILARLIILAKKLNVMSRERYLRKRTMYLLFLQQRFWDQSQNFKEMSMIYFSKETEDRQKYFMNLGTKIFLK